MKRLIPLLFLLLPAALFAQAPSNPESAMLKRFGLNDDQVKQVLDIQSKTRLTLRQDAVQLRLLRAEMEKALLPASPNMQEVNGYINQMAQTRAEMMKTLVAARVQLRQIIGDDNFPLYARFIMHRYGLEGRGTWGWRTSRMPMGPQGMMGGRGSMMRDPPRGDDPQADIQDE